VDKIALVAATILSSILLIMWLNIAPVLNAPLPAGQRVVLALEQKEEKSISFSNQVIQSVPDPELATVKDITSERLNSTSNSSKPVIVETPGWITVIKKVSVERSSPQRVKFMMTQDIAKFPKLVEVIALADLKFSNKIFRSGNLTAIRVDGSEAKDIILFLEGKGEVLEEKQYTWTVMFGMSTYTVQMVVSNSPPDRNN